MLAVRKLRCVLAKINPLQPGGPLAKSTSLVSTYPSACTAPRYNRQGTPPPRSLQTCRTRQGAAHCNARFDLCRCCHSREQAALHCATAGASASRLRVARPTNQRRFVAWKAGDIHMWTFVECGKEGGIDCTSQLSLEAVFFCSSGSTRLWWRTLVIMACVARLWLPKSTRRTPKAATGELGEGTRAARTSF